jgi:ankyrin repeat protein
MVLRGLEKGADVCAPGGNYGSALQAAAHSGSQELICLMKNGANVNQQVGEYGTALQAACDRGHKEVAQLQ